MVRAPLSTSGDKALALRLCRKRMPTKMESSETSKVFCRRKKKSTIHVDTYMGRLRGRVCGSLNSFYGAFLPDHLWPIILICLVQGSYLVYLRILSCVRTHLLAKMTSTEEGYG